MSSPPERKYSFSPAIVNVTLRARGPLLCARVRAPTRLDHGCATTPPPACMRQRASGSHINNHSRSTSIVWDSSGTVDSFRKSRSGLSCHPSAVCTVRLGICCHSRSSEEERLFCRFNQAWWAHHALPELTSCCGSVRCLRLLLSCKVPVLNHPQGSAPAVSA
jgi:hypothetical protein